MKSEKIDIGDIRQADERLVALSGEAAAKALALMERDKEGPWLRIGISGGGCNGLSYKLKFTDKLKKNDIYVDSHGVTVVVDSKSALYLKGTQLDYSEDLINGGFKFVNPNATSSCSCGESFSV